MAKRPTLAFSHLGRISLADVGELKKKTELAFDLFAQQGTAPFVKPDGGAEAAAARRPPAAEPVGGKRSPPSSSSSLSHDDDAKRFRSARDDDRDTYHRERHDSTSRRDYPRRDYAATAPGGGDERDRRTYPKRENDPPTIIIRPIIRSEEQRDDVVNKLRRLAGCVHQRIVPKGPQEHICFVMFSHMDACEAGLTELRRTHPEWAAAYTHATDHQRRIARRV